jgi:hypothetical protein
MPSPERVDDLFAMCVPILVTEEQGLSAGARDYRSPVADLLKAVLTSALCDIFQPCLTFRTRRLRSEALAWVRDDSLVRPEMHPFLTFADCCAACQLEPAWIRHGIEQGTRGTFAYHLFRFH